MQHKTRESGSALKQEYTLQINQELKQLDCALKQQSCLVQMSELKDIDCALRQEYTVRRRMLIERAKVTLQSLMWAEKVQSSDDLKRPAQAAAQQGEALMHNEPAVTLDDVFNAKQGALNASCLKPETVCTA